MLDSHVTYPLLGYFRSSHDNLSWISALGTVLDAAALVRRRSRASRAARRSWSCRWEAISSRTSRTSGSGPARPAGSTRSAFDAVYARLAAAGYDLVGRDEAWAAFSVERATYADRLETMANYWDVATTSWLGGSEPLRSPTHPRSEAATTGDDVSAEIG